MSPLDKVEEPASLVALRTAIAGRLPRVDLPEILLEIAARTDFAVAFTHVSKRAARVTDLGVSVCAVLLAEACNTLPLPGGTNQTRATQKGTLGGGRSGHAVPQWLVTAIEGTALKIGFFRAFVVTREGRKV